MQFSFVNVTWVVQRFVKKVYKVMPNVDCGWEEMFFINEWYICGCAVTALFRLGSHALEGLSSLDRFTERSVCTP